MPLTILLTGFGAFPGAPFNPTTALAQRLATGRRPAFAEVRRIAHVFRTSYAAVEHELPALLARTKPDVVLLFGVATRTNYLRIEMRARNARSPLFPDVDGIRPGSATMTAGAPAVHRSRAPHGMLLAAVRTTRVSVRLSHSAGRYLCNFAYWRALAASEGNPARVVQFIHVPKVRRVPMRPAPARRRVTPSDLARAGEAVLMKLIVAARARQREAARSSRKRPAVAVSVQAEPRPKRERREALAG